MTLDLPDDLAKQVKLLAVHEDQKLKDTVAQLLRRGLSATGLGSPATVTADKAMLQRRKEMTRKFISGEWGVELAGFEPGRKADRQKAVRRAKTWRE